MPAAAGDASMRLVDDLIEIMEALELPHGHRPSDADAATPRGAAGAGLDVTGLWLCEGQNSDDGAEDAGGGARLGRAVRQVPPPAQDGARGSSERRLRSLGGERGVSSARTSQSIESGERKDERTREDEEHTVHQSEGRGSVFSLDQE